VVTYHSDIVKQKRALLLYRPLMNAFLGSVDRIVATSPNYAATSPVLRKFRDKVAVVPIGLEPPAAPTGGASEAWRKRFGDRFFLFAGVFSYYKGLDILLDAARQIDAPVVVVGDGPLAPHLKHRATNENIRNLHFVGAVSDADKFALLALCRAFVFPSNARSEAFGLSLVEASLMGKPMVTCEIGSGTSFVNVDGVTGFVVPPDDATAFAAAMAKLAAAPDLAMTMGMAARRRFDQTFTADAMARGYDALYRELLSGPRREQGSSESPRPRAGC
jgi:rhamnosyl/mannosyltransferase